MHLHILRTIFPFGEKPTPTQAVSTFPVLIFPAILTVS